MKLIFSKRARRDLEKIGVWIARDNPDRAISFVRELREASREIPNFPEAYPSAPEFGPGVRKRTFGDYLILYRADTAIRIIAIHHGARLRRPL